MTAAVSLRTVIEATRRLDELGTARWIEAAAEVVHKAQSQGQPIGKLTPDSLVMREGNLVLELPSSPSSAYRAPELLRGGSGDRRSDVWSLGVMLWEALAHVRLFDGVNDSAIRAAVESGEIAPVNEMNANVPAELGAICSKALQRDPTNRYQSAKAMAAEISAVLDDAGYPEGNDAITRWIASTAPTPAAPALAPIAIAPVPAPAPAPVPAPVPAPTPVAAAPSKPLNQTVMGIAPLVMPAAPVLPKDPIKPKPAAAVVENKTEPLTSIDIIEHRPMTPVADVIPLDNPIIPLSTKKPLNDTLQDTKPAFLDQKPGALTKGWDIPEEPKPAPVAAREESPRARADSKAPTSSLPAWAQRPGSTQPPPVATVKPAEVVTPAPAPFNPATTLQGISNPSIVPPNLKLPEAPPGATVTADKPPAFATTSLVGSSLSNAVPGANPAPAKFDGARTVTMGSNSIIEATNAAVSAANPPALVPNPPILPGQAAAAVAPAAITPAPAVVPAPAPAVTPTPSPGVAPATALPAAAIGTPAIKISEAETVGTPAVPPSPELDVKITIPRTPTPQPDIRAVNWDTPKGAAGKSGAATAVEPAVSKSSGSTDDKATASASAVVSLPRAASRGDKTGKADVLQGWGWGTDSHAAMTASDDDGDASYEEDRKKHKKRMVIVFGAVGAAALLVVGLAFAFSGDGKPAEEPVAKTTAPIGDPAQAGGGAPTPEPVKPDPVPAPVTPEPAPPEPVKPEPVKPEPVKPEPAVTKVEPKKPDPVVTKVEPKKPITKVEPKKPVVTKVEPKKPDPVKVKPEDPYKPKVDAAAAYKVGFQQYVKGDANGALATFKEALSSNPGYAPTWRGIGLVYEKLGRKSQAATAFKKYLELSPNAGDAEQIRNRLEKL